MKPFALALLALTFLAGCGQQPGLAPVTSKAGAFAAKKNTSTKAALVKVPAEVTAFAIDRYQKLQQQYDAPGQTLSATVYLVASSDHFKHVRYEAKVAASELAKNPGAGHDFVIGMLNGDVAPGKYEYYLVLKSAVFTQSKNRLDVEELEDFYVSDYGRNYPVVLQ